MALMNAKTLAGVAVVAAAAIASPAEGARPLTASQAKRAVKVKADKLAGQPTRVSSIITTGRGRFYAQASWTKVDPAGCKSCGFDPATGQVFDEPTSTQCWAGFNVSRSVKTRRIVVRLRDEVCP